MISRQEPMLNFAKRLIVVKKNYGHFFLRCFAGEACNKSSIG